MKQVLILGNGISRNKVKQQIQEWKFDLWACNWAFKEAVQYNINRIYSVHSEVIEEAYSFKEENNLDYLLYSTRRCSKKFIDGYFKKDLGWSTGNLAIIQAFEERYTKIFLAGFDFGGADIYQTHSLPGENFLKQFKEILKKYDKTKLFFLEEQKVSSVSEKETNIFANISSINGNRKQIANDKIPYFSLENIKHKEVLILGNSPDVLNHTFGEYIDNFEIVVRINDYETENYEKNIGTKTDIWFTGASKRAKKRSNLDLENISIILGLSSSRLHMNEDDRKRERLFKDLLDTFDISIEKYTAIPFQIFTLLKNKFNIPFPTTGFLAIFYFVEFLKVHNVVIHGFDFFDTPYHYYDEDKKMKMKIGAGHSTKHERKIVNDWAKSGKIKILQNEINNTKLPLLSSEEKVYLSKIQEKLKEPILLIANGPSVKNYEFSEEIDKFGTVIRLNDFQISNYEKNIGRKIDLWFTGVSKRTQVRRRNKVIGKIFAVVPDNTAKIDEEEVQNRIGFFKREVCWMPSELFQSINSPYKYNSKKRASTGSIVLQLLVNILGRKIVVHGFDFYDKKEHYYEDQDEIKSFLGHGHDWEYEKLIYAALIQENKILELKDYIEGNNHEII